jgi:glycosyltransferase involved in cell wall biosynthesis
MNIGFEAKRFFTNQTGLGNYSRFIIDALSNYASENQYHLYTPRLNANNEITPILKRTNVKTHLPSKFYKITHTTSLWRSWGMCKDPSIKNLQIFHGLSHELPVNFPKHVKKVVTVHDLIFYRFPQFYKSVDVSIYKTKLTHACKNADKIIAISEQTSQDLQQFLKVDPAKIEVVYQGCHPNFKRHISEAEKRNVKLKYNLPDRYILNVGTIEVRKNIKVLIEALAMLPKEERIPLVVVGKATPYLKEVIVSASKLDVLDNIIFIHNASFQDFPAIYQQAEVFVYPSLFEGFGIPLVEAIESGVPVVTSTGSCFREAAGPDALYADPDSPEELSFHLKNILTHPALREKMISESKKYTLRFSPQNVAKDMMTVYNQMNSIV